MKRTISIVLILISFLSSTNVFAWGLTGHRIVAQIAEQHIRKKTSRQINKIIGGQKLAYWVNWADFIKSDQLLKKTEPYHYINLPGNLTRLEFDEALEVSSDKNLYKKTLFFISELKNNKSLSLSQKQQDLYFLIHMLGDAHQPLHVGRFEDLGGNKIKVEWFGKKTNIHAVWDSSLIDHEKYSYTEYSNLLDIKTKDECKEIQQGNYADWIYESYSLANQIYSKVKMDDKLSYRYVYDYKYIVEDQLLKGGLRLAKVLDDIFK